MLAANPLNVILPVVDPHVVGLADLELMNGLDLIVTVALADEKQFDDVTIPVTW